MSSSAVKSRAAFWMTILPLPLLTKNLVEKKLNAFCAERNSTLLQDKVRFSYAIRDSVVTLHEERASLLRPGTWIPIPVVQFRFDPGSTCWTLYTPDRLLKWQRYGLAKPSTDFDTLLDAVDADTNGVFWG